jgi:voltage-gated potassium channel
VLEVVLALYSVAVFATLAGSVGAYFLRGETAAEAPHYARPDTAE